MRRGTNIYEALSHPIRKSIIILLGEHGSLRAKDLKKYLNIGPGQLYYHLNILGDLVAKNEEGEYILTRLGREVYSAITGGEAPRHPGELFSELNPILRSLSMIFFPKVFFNYIFGSPLRHVAEAISIIVVTGYLSFLSGFSSILLIPYPIRQSISASYIYLGISLFSIYIISDVLSTIFFRRRGNHIKLLIGIIFSYIPITVFYLVIYLGSLYGFKWGSIFGGLIFKASMVICQAYTISLLSSALSSAKDLRIDRASLIMLIVAYLSIIVYLSIQ